MTRTRSVLVCLGLLVAIMPAAAVDSSVQLVIELPANSERQQVLYQCADIESPIPVEYINAEPLFLAFVPIEGETRLFVNVLSADGARYASGQYEWWTRGSEAQLIDLTAGEEAEPIACQEVTMTP